MVVRDFDLVGVVPSPNETNTILIVDADTVLALPVAMEFSQSVSRRDFQIFQFHGSVNHRQFSLRYAGGRRPASLAALPDVRRRLVGETLDHVIE
jgi:hypothetical protein